MLDAMWMLAVLTLIFGWGIAWAAGSFGAGRNWTRFGFALIVVAVGLFVGIWYDQNVRPLVFWEVVGWLAWSASFVNILAMALQLKTLVETRETKGVSLGMMGIFAYVQGTFCLVGFHEKQWAIFFGMLGSILFTLTIIVLVWRLRKRGRTRS